jgi:hypothetical protein
MRRMQRGVPAWRAVVLGLSWPAIACAQQWTEPAALPVAPLPQPSTSAPEPTPVSEPPVPWQPPRRTVRDVEILHGNQRVWPPPSPRPLSVLIIPVATPAPSSAGEKATSRSDKDETKPPVVESRTIILASHAGVLTPAGETMASAAPWLNTSVSHSPPPGTGGVPVPWYPSPVVVPSAAPPTATAPPQVIVLRERDGDIHSSPNPPVSSPEQARGITLSHELLLGLGVGVIGLGIGAWGWRRRKMSSPSRGTHLLPYVPLGGDGVLLMGRYNAGPRPTTAEKFDIGPSYAAMREEKKKIEAQNQQALVEFILGQNVALHQELYGTTPDCLPMAEECHEGESASIPSEKALDTSASNIRP